MAVRRSFFVALALGFCTVSTIVNAQTTADPLVFGVFAGSSPAGEAIRPILQIPQDANAELIEWNLTLYQDRKTKSPTTYRLHCDYGPAVANLPGLGKKRTTVLREGSWTIGKGIKSNPEAVVYELKGAVSLFRIAPDVLHVLNRDQTLMIGTSGWSYTLNRMEASEKPVDPAVAAAAPDLGSYSLSPVATGPGTLGVFEGRSPCQGIARDLNMKVHAGCNKAKWRVTLHQNPAAYKIEGTLYRQRFREGNWSIIRGTETDPKAIVYRLAPTKTEAALYLLKGDDNVLFFLDQNRKPLVGHSRNSYTLNRR